MLVMNRGAYHVMFLCVIVSLILSSHCLAQSTEPGMAITMKLVGDQDIYAPGESIFVITEIRNSAAAGRVDVIVSYELLDGDMVLYTETVTVAIETLSSFSEDFTLPKGLESGYYTIRASVESLDHTKYSEAVSTIEVRKVAEESRLAMEYFMGLSFAGVLIALLYEHRRVSKMRIEKDDLQKFVNIERKNR